MSRRLIDGVEVRMGGHDKTLRLDLDDPFEAAVETALGDQIRADTAVAKAMWSALANVDWTHDSGAKLGYSFRAAGDLIAAVRGEGSYLDWYCCAADGVVRADIAEALAEHGWTPTLDAD